MPMVSGWRRELAPLALTKFSSKTRSAWPALSLSKAQGSRPVTASDESAASSARQLANDILVKVDTNKAYADVLLHHALNKTALGPSDRGLMTELVYGTLRW